MFGVGLGGYGGGGFGNHFPFGFGGYGGAGDAGAPAESGAFSRRYRAHDVATIGRAELEQGDKIVLPSSALDALTRLHIQYPMTFRISREAATSSSERGSGSDAAPTSFTHCGVLEFVAEEGHAYVPGWMLARLGCSSGAIVRISNAKLRKGTDVTLRPKTSSFLDISNPKVVLEATLRNFTCLTVSDSLPINYNSRTYWIDVVKLQPDDAVTIVEADVRTEFEPPPGYEEELERKRLEAFAKAAAESVPSGAPAEFQQQTLGGSAGTDKTSADSGGAQSRLAARLSSLKKHRGDDSSGSDEDDDAPATAKPQVKAFSGAGYSLAGSRARRGYAPVTAPTGSSSNASSANPPARVEAETTQASSTAENAAGSSASGAKPSFIAFSGQGRSLRD
mmetsp:Transcript_8799/g.23073  ORF Transcript_8799/g.23073 Transcript_8799/m.23073 type:complete len:393 (-) Transcript_8799:168-1346(-)